MFFQFVTDYKKYFEFANIQMGIKHSYYKWHDQIYRDFMVETLSCLEPRREFSGVILFNELDDFTEILFFNKGIVELGYELNRKKYFILQQKNSVIIGDHGCIFNHRCSYIYRTAITCEGYFIRKLPMKNILDKYPEIST